MTFAMLTCHTQLASVCVSKFIARARRGLSSISAVAIRGARAQNFQVFSDLRSRAIWHSAAQIAAGELFTIRY